LAQDRDRFAREPAFLSYLREAFGQHGCKLRALNDRGDDSPESQLTDGILDQRARFERIKIAAGSQQRKLRNARYGKIVAPHTFRYGFKLNAARDDYKVNEAEMEIVCHIFRMVGAEGRTPGSLARVLEKQGVPSYKGTKRWDRTYFRACLLNGV
jgi:site-specific DNA recombinase